MNWKEKMIHALRVCNENARIKRLLRTGNLLAVSAGFGAFVALLVWLAVTGEYLVCLRVAVAAAVPFVLVTVLRAAFNAPRPYEVYDFYTMPPREKKGHSFPSRHVFSLFLIATLLARFYPLPAAVLFVLGICLCVCRVLLGIHFIRDVAAGALLGVVSGLVGLLILR